MNEQVFRAYDVRGKVGTQLTEDLCHDIGRALATRFVKEGETFVIGMDARLHSPQLASALKNGLLRQGVRVLDCGHITTPMLYFACIELKAAGGVMITGSHNPIDENGLKIVLNSISISSQELTTIKEIVKKGEYDKTNDRGIEENVDIFPAYANALQERIKIAQLSRPIVIDAGNASAGPPICKILDHYKISYIPINCTLDGRFPNHHPDPSIPSNLAQLQEAVRKEKALFGLAFDGDGDRLGLVDENAQIIPADRILILLAQKILSESNNKSVIADIKCSQITFDEIKKAGGNPIIWKTGHSFIKKKMRETNATLAGEMSGHFFFNSPWFAFDDAIYAALKIIQIAALENISEKLAALPQTHASPEIRIDCPDDKKFEIVQNVLNEMKQRYEVSDLDGVRVNFPHGWALLRASNTQATLVCRVEANNIRELEILYNAFSEACQKNARSLGVNLNFPNINNIL